MLTKVHYNEVSGGNGTPVESPEPANVIFAWVKRSVLTNAILRLLETYFLWASCHGREHLTLSLYLKL